MQNSSIRASEDPGDDVGSVVTGATQQVKHESGHNDSSISDTEAAVADAEGGPYAVAAEQVRASGLGSPLPLPYGAKMPPPAGFTGRGAPHASGADVEEWLTLNPEGNVAIRLAHNVVGIDRDDHKGPQAAETIGRFEAACGDLPTTYRITSRDDDRSGVYLYRLPEGMSSEGMSDIGPSVEVIREGHRYVVAPPSIHPNGATYRVESPDGKTLDALPNMSDLPRLTGAQIEGVSQATPSTPVDGSEDGVEPLTEGLAYGDLSEAVRGRLAAWLGRKAEGHKTDLAEATTWAEGHRDGYGRGWQKIVADVANDLGRTARAEWNAWGLSDAENIYRAALPAVMADALDADHLWRSQCGRREPAAVPGWLASAVAGEAAVERLSSGGSAGSSVMAAEGEDDPESAFWSSSLTLSTIFDYSLARMVSPWAVLGCLLVRVGQTVPPGVTLPPIVGGRASLNLFCAVVGPSGSGKDAADDVAAEAVTLPCEVFTTAPGSGEGFAHVYVRRVKDEIETLRTAALFKVSEVDALAALSSRNGSTLDSVIRDLYGGARLGHAYVDPAKRVPVEAHTYRAGLIVGVQPRRSSALFDGSDGGTPQRFLWMPATDRRITADAVEAPKGLVLPDQHWPAHLVLSVPDEAAQTVREARAARNRGEADALDGHALLTRLKVASLLTVLEGRRHMTLSDWGRAEHVMSISDCTRREALAEIRKASEERAESRGRLRGVEETVASDYTATKAVERVSRVALAKIIASGVEGMTAGAVSRAGTARDRQYVPEALARLLARGEVTLSGKRYQQAEGA